MGAARQRKERRARNGQRTADGVTRPTAAGPHPADTAEVAFFIEKNGAQINFSVVTRDLVPDETSPAIIFASFLRNNLQGLFQGAMQSYHAVKAAEAEKSAIVTELPTRSILAADGSIARRTDDANLILPPGYAPVMQAQNDPEPEPIVSAGGGDFGGGGADASFEAQAATASTDGASSDLGGGGE